MKVNLLVLLLIVCTLSTAVQAQKPAPLPSTYGNTLNAGVGIGYYGYIGQQIPVLHANFEINAAPNFTLAPFVTYYSYKRYQYWGSDKYAYRDYYYRQTAFTLGVKGSYYFDQLLHAGSKWDFYLAGSLGYTIRKTVWEDGYYGDIAVKRSASGVYLDAHIGTEFHLTSVVGLFLDLSTGISTFGLAFHL